jgi:hypothetical protein
VASWMPLSDVSETEQIRCARTAYPLRVPGVAGSLGEDLHAKEDAMIRQSRMVTYVLVGMLVLSGRLANSADTVSLTTQADLDKAIAKTLNQEDAARSTITTLLQRSEVRSMARGYGLDLRRAEGAVKTLQGDELQRLSLLAAHADAQLAGGDQYVSISLVALLLIVIIVILVTR